MAIAHLAHLDGIESTSVFTGPLKWMLGWVEIARLANGSRPGRLLRRRRARKSFNFLSWISIYFYQINHQIENSPC
jgi:hypothetical protein